MLSAVFLGWAVFFWIAALLSYVIGFSNVAATTFSVANVLGVIALSLAVLYFILYLATKPRTVSHQGALSHSRFARVANRLLHWPYSSE